MKPHRFHNRTSICSNTYCWATPGWRTHRAESCPISIEKANDLSSREGQPHPLPFDSIEVHAELEKACLAANQSWAAFEALLFRWHDSIEECCRRGLDARGITKVITAYVGIEAVERRMAAT